TVGQTVAVGDGLIVLEAMKMENEFKAAVAGTVKENRAQAGQAGNPRDGLGGIEEAMAAALEVKGVNKWFGRHHVLTDVDLSVDAGEVIVVCGPSGSGKSTLIRCVNRLEPVQQGEIRVLGQPITGNGVNLVRLRTEVGMVFQSFNLF